MGSRSWRKGFVCMYLCLLVVGSISYFGQDADLKIDLSRDRSAHVPLLTSLAKTEFRLPPQIPVSPPGLLNLKRHLFQDVFAI